MLPAKRNWLKCLRRSYPDVNFIIPHFGSFGDDWRAHQQIVDQLVRYPNVYADTSGVRRFDYIVQAVKRAGPHKVLFGSDGPWLHPGVEIHKIRLLGLPPEEETLILGGNALRLMRRALVGREAAEVPRPVRRAPPGVPCVDGTPRRAHTLDGRLPPGAQPESGVGATGP